MTRVYKKTVEACKDCPASFKDSGWIGDSRMLFCEYFGCPIPIAAFDSEDELEAEPIPDFCPLPEEDE